MHRNKSGFTLIELLTVVLIIGLLAVIALPKFVRTRERSYLSAMQSDLRNLATAEENYFSQYLTYTTDYGTLDFNKTLQVSVSVPVATDQGWRATATHAAAPTRACELYYGAAGGATTAQSEGSVYCN